MHTQFYMRHTERNRKKFALRTVDRKKAHNVFSRFLACCTIRQSILQSETWPYPACGSKRPIKITWATFSLSINQDQWSPVLLFQYPALAYNLAPTAVTFRDRKAFDHLGPRLIFTLEVGLPVIEWLLQPNLVPRVLSYLPSLRRAGRREPWERGCVAGEFEFLLQSISVSLALRSWRCFWCFLCSCKSLFTWRWGTPGRWDNPLRWGNPPIHIIYHFNLITFT